MKSLFDEIDQWLEDHYGEHYPLHPNRPKRGRTSNPEMDGLFNIGADFSPGFGSKLGRGYIIKLRFSTLDNVDEEIRRRIENDVVMLVKEKLPIKFPGRDLEVKHDGDLIKIVGDFSLGTLL